MRICYVDSSVIVRYYLPHDHGHQEAVHILRAPDTAFCTSALTRVEVTGALVRAERRSAQPFAGVFERIDEDFSGALVAPISIDFEQAMGTALSIARSDGIRTLDACHIAAAEQILLALARSGDETFFLARDDAQRAVAVARGLNVM